MRAIFTALVLLAWSTLLGNPTAARADDGKPVERTYTVHFEKAEWVDVLEWYAGVTGLKAEVKVKAEGTVTLKPGKDRPFTSAEVTDLLNELLMKQGLLLVPNLKTFTIVSRAAKIDPVLVRVVELTDLPKLADSTLVEVTIPVPIEVDAEIAADLKTLLTPFGELRSAKGKSVTVRDIVSNVRRLHAALQA